MEKKTSKFGTTAFLICVVSCTNMPYFLKYPLLLVAAISLVIGIYQYQKTFKSTAKPADQAK